MSFFFFVYNYCSRSEAKAIKGKTPAMAVGITDAPFSLERVVSIVDAYRQRNAAKKLEESRKDEMAAFEAAFALKFS